MKHQNIPISILATLFVCAAMQSSARASSPSIQLLKTFGPSDSGDSTWADKINGNGDIAGTFEFPDERTQQGFVRHPNGTVVVIRHPNEKDPRTQVNAINDSGVVAGEYGPASGAGRGRTVGFLFEHGIYTDVVVPGAINTFIYALNNAGDFAGSADFPGNSFQQYLSIGGEVTLFSIPGLLTLASGINNLDQVVGSYVDEGVIHGYLRDADGTLTYPIDYPGAADTVLYGINDKGWMVGSYNDAKGKSHGLFLTSPTDFLAFDVPDADITYLIGINNKGIICGTYSQTFGTHFGLMARVTVP